jgi:hypothetical protein
MQVSSQFNSDVLQRFVVEPPTLGGLEHDHFDPEVLTRIGSLLDSGFDLGPASATSVEQFSGVTDVLPIDRESFFVLSLRQEQVQKQKQPRGGNGGSPEPDAGTAHGSERGKAAGKAAGEAIERIEKELPAES